MKHSTSTILGQGSYGEVFARNGKAVKKFSKLSHLIQEYMALKYLDDCDYVVHAKGVEFSNLELHMELYDSSLRKWLEDQPSSYKNKHIMTVLRDILRGLAELHDRGLAHGDLKPGNILVRHRPLKAVLGDCGFVSIAKYAKVDRTAAIYRDPKISHDCMHDMFSFGICFLEMTAEIKINRQASYEELKQVIRSKITDSEHRKIIYNLLHNDRDRRPSARSLLIRLFNEDPPVWNPENYNTDLVRISNIIHDPISNDYEVPDSNQIVSLEDRKFIRGLMKITSYKFDINRSKKGYGTLLIYINNNDISREHYKLYTAITLMILSSIFGKSGFREQEVLELCEHEYKLSTIYKILDAMISDQQFTNILLSP